jgi:thiosulfate reductase cytochrome b subunit
VIRDIDPWSVFKVGLVFHLVLYLVAIIAAVLLWSVASATGTVDNIERFMESFGWESFSFNGWQLFRSLMVLGLMVAVLLTGIWVLAATVFNLIADLVGGVQVTVLEQEVVAASVEVDQYRQ